MLLYLPLDDRPPNLIFPQHVAKTLGLDLLLPPRKLLGRYLDPGDRAALSAWLLENCKAADTAIISLDMLCYGGLVASRTTQVNYEDAMKMMEVIEELKSRSPHLEILLHSVIMRSS
ncbi:MAG: DUF4127 family protein, partial [bacterium]